MNYPKSVRLLKRYQFKRVSYRAQRLLGHFISVEISQSRFSSIRLGVTVTKAFGCAVVRNRFKRVVREGFRACYTQLPQGVDIVVRPRSESASMKSSDVTDELKKLLRAL